MFSVFTQIQDLIAGCDWDDISIVCVNNVRTILLFGVSFVACWLMFRKPRGIPPGPRFPLPIIGDLLWLSDENPRLPLRKMRKQYGDIFSFYIGQRLVVCLNGFEMIKEALVKNGDVFSDRPSMCVYDVVLKRGGIFSSNGQQWKDQRKFALENLREFGFGRPIMDDKIKEEIAEYISVLDQHINQPYDMRGLTQKAISNTIGSLVFGQRHNYDDKTFQQFVKALDDLFEATGTSAVSNHIPILQYLPGDLFSIRLFVRSFMFLRNEIISPSIKDHEKNFDENDTRDFISTYLKEMKRFEKTGQKSYIDGENLIVTIADLLLAGSETTSTTILWIILYLINHPDIQARCYTEVQDVVGSGRLPSLKDRELMPFTLATIQEVQRISNIVVTNDPHAVSKDIIFRGYFIPKGTVIIANLDSVLADADIWGDPEVFRPERFLDDNGQLMQREEFIPFSTGRRVCIGESLAKIELFLYITTLIQRYEFRSVDPEKPTAIKGIFGITYTPENFDVVLVPR